MISYLLVLLIIRATTLTFIFTPVHHSRTPFEFAVFAFLLWFTLAFTFLPVPSFTISTSTSNTSITTTTNSSLYKLHRTIFTDTPFKMLIVTSAIAALNLNTFFSIFTELLSVAVTKAVLFSTLCSLFVPHTIPVALPHEDTLFTGFSILHKMQSLAPIRWITLAAI